MLWFPEAAGMIAESTGPGVNAAIELKRNASKIYYIALKEEMSREIKNKCGNILDYSTFRTHGYIPVWSTQADAVQALNTHCQGRVQGRKELKIYIGENSKL